MKLLKERVIEILESNQEISQKRKEICCYLKEEVSHYDWVGFYFRNGAKEELILTEFCGKPTEHTTIPFGKGICGQVAVSNKNFVVPDVSEQDNYISCGIDIKSEIVIPIFKEGKNIGQIDVDSHQKDPFSEEDVELLEFICGKVAEIV